MSNSEQINNALNWNLLLLVALHSLNIYQKKKEMPTVPAGVDLECCLLVHVNTIAFVRVLQNQLNNDYELNYYFIVT